ncbi:hypothetical protein DL769_001269 [Monosporascus sp. CRB-8-3]|nr:hypothetical protein DL769_001269 [Monosporascus sp. CRB-8-3]
MFDSLPAMQPPPGVMPNFIDPPSLAPAGRILIGVTLPLVLMSVVSRLYVRLFITRATGADDYLCVVSAAGVISYCAVTLSILGDSLGPHQWNVRLSAITPNYITGSIVVTCLYSVSAMLIKTSLLVLYLRVFQPVKSANISIWIGIGTIVLFYVICIITTSVYCNSNRWPNTANPVEFLAMQAESSCNRPQLTLSAAQGIFSTLSDVYVLIIPTILVWGLRLPLGRRIGICGIFLVGSVATGCSIATVYFRFHQRVSADFSWDSALNMILGAAELNVGIICSCIPVSFILPKRITTTSWTSIREYLTQHLRRSGSATAHGNEPKPSRSPDAPRHGLPKIPSATIRGLRTFIWGDSSRKPVELTEMSDYAELGSVDQEYHGHLKKALHPV